MLKHVLAVLGLLILAVETWRTVRRFELVRPGALIALVQSPTNHVATALVIGVGSLLLGAGVAAVPSYVAPIGAAIALYYLVASVRFMRRRQQARRVRGDRSR